MLKSTQRFKNGGGATDIGRVKRPFFHAIDDVLRGLDRAFVVGAYGSDRLIGSPTGLFVTTPVDDRPAPDAARHAADLAARTRNQFATHLAWVPFVTPLAVRQQGDQIVPDASATVVPLDLLTITLSMGPEVIDAPSLAALRGLLASAVTIWTELGSTSLPVYAFTP